MPESDLHPHGHHGHPHGGATQQEADHVKVSDGPPLVFQGVTSRVFPLLASYERLETFCNAYLNVSDRAYFRPAFPIVLFQALNYGRMSGKAFELGWVSQQEFLFMVLLEWYEPDANGGWRFKDWATVTPFIFVNDAISVQGGREVFGWPKVFASAARESNPWMEDPRLPRRLVSLRSPLFSRLYRGEPLEDHLLIRIEQTSSETALQVPFDLSSSVGPLVQGVQTLTSSATTLLEFLLGGIARLTGLGGRGPVPTSVVDIASKTLKAVLRGTQAINTVNLKQFRASDPDSACYQALVNAEMQLLAYNAGGPLGEVAMLRGDMSGGFRITVRSHDAYPIVETLGLRHPVVSSSNGVPFTRLSPVLPFWLNVDLSYDLGERVCWRAPGTDGTRWKTTVSGKRIKPAGTGSGDPVPEGGSEMPSEDGAGKERVIVPPSAAQAIPYNSTLGPMVAPVGGSLVFFDTDIKILPLAVKWTAALSHCEKVRECLHLLSGSPPPVVEPFPRVKTDGGDKGVIFLVATDQGQMSAAANNLGCWADKSLQFVFVVKVHFAEDEGGGRTKLFLLPVMDFADSTVAVTTGREAWGLPTYFASIDGCEDKWMQHPLGPRELLRAKTKLFPALDVGQSDRQEVFLKVIQAGIDELANPEPTNVVLPGLRRLKEAGRVEVGLAFDYLSFKCYPSADKTHDPCYSGLVGWRTLIGQFDKLESERKPVEIDPLPGPLKVAILREPTLQLAWNLGLDVEQQALTQDASVYDLCPVLSPFRVHGTMYWDSPKDLLWQVLVERPVYMQSDSYEYLTQTGSPYRHYLRLTDLLARMFPPPTDESGGPRAGPEPGSEGRPSTGEAPTEETAPNGT